MKIFCGCCGELYHKTDALAGHINSEGFHLRKSKIPRYNRERFDLSGYLAEYPLSDSSAEAAASVPAATSGASQPQATQAGALPSTLLRGAPDIYRLPACCLVDAISAAVNPILASLAPSSLAGSSCTTSTTVIVSPNTLLGSVFTIRDPIPSVSHTVTSAPATITRDPETPLRDETPLSTPRLSTPGVASIPVVSPPSVHPPILQIPDQSAAVSQPPVPTSAVTVTTCTSVATSTVQSSTISSSVQLPNFQPGLTAAFQNTSQAPVIQIFPQYTPFDALFPPNFYLSVGTMPTSLLLQFMVHALWWTSGLLRGMLTAYPLLPSLVGFDEIGRAILMASPLWPANQINMDSDLTEVLAALHVPWLPYLLID